MTSLRVPILFLALVALGCSPAATPTDHSGASGHEAAAPSKADPPAKGSLTRVEPELICMINNRFMGTPQIPVEVEGTTYYGCCEMCKGRLANEPDSRSAMDPVSHAKVDKAHAVLGKTAEGDIYYFENEQNLAAYVEPAA